MADFDQAMAWLHAQDESDHVGRASAMGDAMVDVLAVSLLAKRENGERRIQDDPTPFYTHVREVLRANRTELAAWLGAIDIALWRRNRNGWYDACMGRSAAEVLVDEVDDDAEPPLVPAQRLSEVDDEMREIGPALNALPPDAIPRGIPTSHWWWNLPEGPDEDDLDNADYSY